MQAWTQREAIIELLWPDLLKRSIQSTEVALQTANKQKILQIKNLLKMGYETRLFAFFIVTVTVIYFVDLI